ncbi:hypothetical protein HGRIS_000434 [Hohenbuehelia grisea]|uniref:Uncharacterized protein n=1 Tax=Hohenbuehelia grisea TaxID=104357 RepID=A0ABR3JSX3_9AGAR
MAVLLVSFLKLEALRVALVMMSRGVKCNANSHPAGNAADITTSGRPPFDGANTTCFLSQFANAIYVLRGDNANPSAVHIYDATAKSWSTQATDAGSFDVGSAFSILDRDTNVFYSISKGELWSLDMGDQKSAKSSSIAWADQKPVAFPTDGWNPVGALANNHVHYLNVPGVAAGSAQIFVIHFSFFQPDAQSYGNFPAANGQAFSVFKDPGVQEEFAFVPDDGSATYVINVINNSTQTLPGPSSKDPKASYFASPSALVQLSPSSNAINFFAYNPNNANANKAASWSSVSVLAGKLTSDSPASGSGSGSATVSGGSSSTRAGTATGAAQAGSSGNGALPGVGGRSVVAAVGAAVAAALGGLLAVL